MKIINDMVKKMFLEKNEEVYMIPKKFDYILDQQCQSQIHHDNKKGQANSI